MATSQFTIYTSSDTNGPGFITGTTGSVIRILDACLVNGYTNRPAAGWTKPLPNISGTLACYQQPSGSLFVVMVNDATQNGVTAKEAVAVGFETISSLTGSVGAGSIFTGSYGLGTGFGQFPALTQGVSGHVTWRKSVTADTTIRPWVVAADAYTFYLWIQTGDTAGAYYHGSFGDIFSLKGPTDTYRCMLTGRNIDNSAAALGNDWSDQISAWNGANNALLVAQPGVFMPRNIGGTGGSVNVTKKGDSGAGTLFNNTSPQSVSISGLFQTPNGADNSLYLSPIWIVDPSVVSLRGRLRGIFQLCHPIANFTDGQQFNGSGDFAGKSFMIIKNGPQSGMWTLEISPTVETN